MVNCMSDQKGRRHPTAIMRCNMDTYVKSSKGREMDKSLILPSIIKASDSVQKDYEINEEYKDSQHVSELRLINSQSSLRANNFASKGDLLSSKSKSVCTRNKSKMDKHSKESLVSNSVTSSSCQYVEHVYRQQKCSFVKFERSNPLGVKQHKLPKSQTRKSTLPYLSPDHQEVIVK